MKLTTGKQAVMVASEVLESFGGAGFIEDTGLPVLLRDSQVLPIWEGTTNVLSLDTLRALDVRSEEGSDIGHELQPLQSKLTRMLETVNEGLLTEPKHVALAALDHADAWLRKTKTDQTALEAGARRFAITLGRSMELALLISHAQWSQKHENDGRATAAARRFARSGIDLIIDDLTR